jgi:PAS domain-containing protein
MKTQMADIIRVVASPTGDAVGGAVDLSAPLRREQPLSRRKTEGGLASALRIATRADQDTQELLFETLLDNIPFGVAVHSMKAGDVGRCLLWNQANEVMFGVAKKKSPGRKDR